MANTGNISGSRNKPAPAQLPPDHDDRNQQTPGIGLADVKTDIASARAGYDNMELWEKLRRVDPVHSKSFQRPGGFRGTAIKPAEQERLMTETFGPVGFGWGTTKPEYKEVAAGDELLVYCTIGAWYRWNGEKSDIFWGEGGDKIVTVRANGTVSSDDEARKKALTDAIGNAIKRIGMAADIYSGLWDDSKYRDENEKFFAERKKKAEPYLQPPAIEKYEADLKGKLDSVHDLEALDELWRDGTNARIREIGSVDKAAQNRMITAFSQKKNEILKKEQERTEEPDGRQPEPAQAPRPPAASAKPPKADAPPTQPKPQVQSGPPPSEEDVEKADTTIAAIKKHLNESGTVEDAAKVWVTRKGKQAFMKAINIKLASFTGATDVSEYWKDGIDAVANKVNTVSEDDAKAIWQVIDDRRQALMDAGPSTQHRRA